MVRQYSSTAVEATLTAGVSPSATTLPVSSTSGFPGSFPYTLSLDADNASKELVEVTAAAGLNLTVTRGVDGTSGASHSLGAVVRHDHSARDFREPQEHMDATDGVHGVTGDVVGTSDTQTLTNKDLSDPSNTVAQQVPAGAVSQFAGSSAPTGWLLCDGTAVSRATYAALFAVVGTTYGAGDGSTTFNVPNLKGKVPVGRDAAQTEFDTLAETGGAKTHTLSAAEMPSHQHTITHDHASASGSTSSDGAHQHGYLIGYRDDVNITGVNAAVTQVNGAGSGPSHFTEAGAVDSAGSHSHTVTVDLPEYSGLSGFAGSGGAHNNLQPYVVLNFIVKT